MTFEDLEGWQPARQLSEVGGESRRTPQIKAGQPPLSSLRSALFRMNCRQPPHTVLFASDALRSAWPKHDRGLHGPGWGTACACPHKVCDFSFPPPRGVRSDYSTGDWPVKSPWPVESLAREVSGLLLHRALAREVATPITSPGYFPNF
jgi:hypothetical protein